jgi:hypothetical protein
MKLKRVFVEEGMVARRLCGVKLAVVKAGIPQPINLISSTVGCAMESRQLSFRFDRAP